MFDLFKKQPQGDEVTFKIEGMHCASCAMNIDGALEDTKGVVTSNTSYAKSEVKIKYEAKEVDPDKLIKVIEEQGYQVAK